MIPRRQGPRTRPDIKSVITVTNMPPKGAPGLLAARIKRIMQKDDDVGKIAQATPVLIGGEVFPWSLFSCTCRPCG